MWFLAHRKHKPARNVSKQSSMQTRQKIVLCTLSVMLAKSQAIPLEPTTP